MYATCVYMYIYMYKHNEDQPTKPIDKKKNKHENI